MSDTKPLLNNDKAENDENGQRQELQDFGASTLTSPTNNNQIRHRSIAEKQQNKMGERITEPSSSPSSSTASSSTGSPRSSLATNNPSNTRYGTLQSTISPVTSSGFKQTMLVDTRYPRTNFTMKQFCIAGLSMILFIAAVSITLIFGLPRLKAKRDEYFAARFYESPLPEVLHSKFSVLVSGNEYPSCADAGREMLLNHHGSAMDAALASLFCLTISTPLSVGFDSGFRGLVHSDQKTYAFNVMEKDFPLKHNGPTSIKISYPVLPLAAELLWKNFGRVSWSNIIMPTIWLAENGMPISEHLAKEIRRNEMKLSNEMKILHNRFIRLTNSTVRLLNDGEMYKNPLLARTLRLIAENGSMALFQNDFIEEINESFNGTVKNISSNKFRTFLPKDELINFDEPYSFSMFNSKLKILTGSLKDSYEAISFAFMMKILERLIYNEIDSGFNYACNHNNENNDDDDDMQHIVSLKENALKYQYLLDTLQFGGTALAKLRAKQIEESNLLNDNYINEIVKKISESANKKMNQRDLTYFDIQESTIESELINKEKYAGHNVHITVYDDKTGDIVTLTTSKRRSMFDGKSKFISNLTGMIYDIFNDNDEDKDSIQVSWPILIKDVQQQIVHMIIGSVGGRGQFQSLCSDVQVLNNLLLNCQTLKNSIDESRLFYHPPDEFVYESNFPRAFIDLLTRMYDRHTLISTADKQLKNNDNTDSDGKSAKSTTNRQKWLSSGVYAMMKMIHSSSSVSQKRIKSMIDYRSNGYVSGD